MATGDLDIALVLRLVDRVSAPARKVVDTVRRIGAVTEQAGRAGVAWADEQIAANQARGAALQGEAMGLLALGGSLAALTEPAVQAERRLAEVAKVVSFEAPEGLERLQADIRALVTSGGLAATAEGVTDIVAAAGRMGVVDAHLPDDEKRRQLLRFATAASKMSVAFGISAEEAGTTLARWRQNLSLSQREAMVLGDTVNLLGNTMATSEADILQVINRQGVVAKTAGLAAGEIAALSATLLAAGASPEIAATGLKNFTNALTRGESATKRQKDVYAALGVDAGELARRLQDDAAGGILHVLEAFQRLEPYRRGSMVGDLFGEEAKGAIMPLIENADMLRRSFEKTADTGTLLGLMEEEYQRQAETTFAQRRRLFEYVKGLSVVIGASLLPQINQLMETVTPLVARITAWAEAHPGLIQGAFKLAAGLLALKAGTLLARFAFVMLAGPVLRIVRVGAWLLAILPRLGAVLAWVGKGPVRWLLRGVGLLGRAFVRLGALALANPIGLVIASVAALAWVVYDNWNSIVSWFTGKVEEVRAAFDEGLLNGVFKLLAEFNPFTLAYEGAEGLFKYVTGWDFGDVFTGITGSAPFQAAYRSADRFVTRITGWDLSRIWATIKIANPVSVAMQGARAFYDHVTAWDFSQVVADIKARFGEIDLFEAGVKAIRSLWDGMMSLVARMVEDIKDRLTGMLPEWARTRLLGSDGAGEPGRDRGGPVRAGVPYLVGERQAEIFVPGVAGAILPSRVLKAAMAATAMAGPAAAMPSGAGIADRVDRRPAMTTAPAPRITREGDVFHITIAPPPGTDEETIVRLMHREIERMRDARRGDLHDGVDY